MSSSDSSLANKQHEWQDIYNKLQKENIDLKRQIGHLSQENEKLSKKSG
jgi:hypothetical protein